ncbi:MAG: hypothetical protein A2583_10840 [Bdellovibrionales bacterium RIFOXYD1_FULL_53_11]|nr:MAG: hypothetical protein A2583_10840 [Bdellovibrionales bacterium RIFOXYD1_FULL_53_11]
MKKEVRIKSVQVLKYPTIKITWHDEHCEEIDLTLDLKKPMFSAINQNNFSSLAIMYDGCAIGWTSLDVEIGFLRFIEENKQAA